MKALAFGEIIFDEYLDAPADKASYIGGAPLNFAAHTARLGAKCALCSAAGEDENGRKSFDALVGFGIDTSFIYKNNYPTGSCKVTLDENKKPMFRLEKNSAYDYIELDDKEITKISRWGADVFYFGTLAQRNSVSRKSLEKILDTVSFPEVFCDINLRNDAYTPETIRFCLEKATLLKISREEEVLLTELGILPELGEGEHSRRCAELGKHLARSFPQIKCLILTLDKDGAAVFDAKSGISLYAPPREVPLVSTVGAGDSFSAAFAVAYMDRFPLEDCLRRAIILSSFVVSKADAVPDYTKNIFEIQKRR